MEFDTDFLVGSVTRGGINNAFTEALSQCDSGIVSDAWPPSLTFSLSQDSMNSLIL